MTAQPDTATTTAPDAPAVITTTSKRPRTNERRAEVQPIIDAYNDAARNLPASAATRAAGNAMVLVVRYLERAMDDATAASHLTPTGRRSSTRAARPGTRARA